MMDTGRAAAGRKAPAGILLLMPFFISIILLSNFGAGTLLDTSFTFFLIGGFSLIALIMVRVSKIQTFEYFGTLDSNKEGKSKKGIILHDVVYIFIGLGGLLLAAFVITPIIPGTVGILIALTVGGLVLGWTLFKSKTFIVPVLSHALYNMISYLGATFSLISLSASPLYIPTLNLSEGFVSETAKQLLFQLFGVSFAEEMMRISFTIGFGLLLFRNPNTSTNVKVAYIIATLGWTILHSILSYRI